MAVSAWIFWTYSILGFLLIIFSSRISTYLYKMVLVYTNKAHVNDLFLFKVDGHNKDALFIVARLITVVFGLVIALFSLYVLYFKQT